MSLCPVRANRVSSVPLFSLRHAFPASPSRLRHVPASILLLTVTDRTRCVRGARKDNGKRSAIRHFAANAETSSPHARETKMNKSIHLVIIDPQIDFCSPSGALSVQGAERDIERLATMVTRLA